MQRSVNVVQLAQINKEETMVTHSCCRDDKKLENEKNKKNIFVWFLSKIKKIFNSGCCN